MKKLIGKDKYGDYVVQIIEKGKIRGFEVYQVVTLYDGEEVLSQNAWTHSVELYNGKSYKSGKKPAPVVDDAEFNGLSEYNVTWCEECGAAFESDDRRIMYLNSGCICKDCVKPQDLLVEIETPEDLFKAHDMTHVAKLKGFRKVDVLFCDSSGFGSPSESALTKSQALAKVEELLKKAKGPIFCGLTGIGQFQVYVTIWKRSK